MRSCLIAVVAVVSAATVTPALRGQSPAPFTFTDVDLKLLAEFEAFDRQLENRGLVYHDADLERHLTEVATPLLPAAPLEHVIWKFRILRDPMVNAFALANGSVYVFSGLLARAENNDQLAAVLAHEVTHVTGRHSYLFNRSLRKKVVISQVLAGAVAWSPVGSLIVVAAGSTGQLVMLATVYGFSRQMEEEADRVGLERMKQTGRDPMQMVRVFAVMEQRLEPEPVPFFFKDHPTIETRIAYLKKILGTDQDPPAGSDSGYLARIRPVIRQNIQLDLDRRRFRSAVAAAERLANLQPEDPEALCLLGESYLALGPRQPRLSEKEQTNAGLRIGFSRTRKRTEAEDNKALSATPEGRAALQVNQHKAEELFLRAIRLAPAQSEPYFGMGSLFEQQGKRDEAIAAYLKSRDLALQPAEKLRAERRIEQLRSQPAGGAK